MKHVRLGRRKSTELSTKHSSIPANEAQAQVNWAEGLLADEKKFMQKANLN